MTIAIAVIGALALISGLFAILLVRGKGRLPTDQAMGFMGIVFGVISWLFVALLVALSFFKPGPLPVEVQGIGCLGLCFPLLTFLTTGRGLITFWILGWLSSTAFYILLLAL